MQIKAVFRPNTADHIHVILGKDELWIPNVPRVYLPGPIAPERERYCGRRVKRVGRNGDVFRLQPHIGTPPYKAITVSMQGKRGINEILGIPEDYELLNGITVIMIDRSYGVKDAGQNNSQPENFDTLPNPFPGFYQTVQNKTRLFQFTTRGLDLFGSPVKGRCASLSNAQPDARWCNIYTQLPTEGVYASASE